MACCGLALGAWRFQKAEEEARYSTVNPHKVGYILFCEDSKHVNTMTSTAPNKDHNLLARLNALKPSSVTLSSGAKYSLHAVLLVTDVCLLGRDHFTDRHESKALSALHMAPPPQVP